MAQTHSSVGSSPTGGTKRVEDAHRILEAMLNSVDQELPPKARLTYVAVARDYLDQWIKDELTELYGQEQVYE